MTPTVANRPAITPERFEQRLRRLRDLVNSGGVDAALIGVGPDLAYLTAYHAMPLERLTMLVLVRDAEPFIIVPRLEEPAARAGLRVDIDVVTWLEAADPHAVVADRVRESAETNPPGPRVAVSDGRPPYHLLRLPHPLPAATG